MLSHGSPSHSHRQPGCWLFSAVSRTLQCPNDSRNVRCETFWPNVEARERGNTSYRVTDALLLNLRDARSAARKQNCVP
jgi:hypothetical protein